MEQSINNKTIIRPATKIVLRRTIIEHTENPNPYAICDVDYMDTNGAIISREQIGFTAEELAGWGEDDTVLLPLVIEKLGVTAK